MIEKASQLQQENPELRETLEQQQILARMRIGIIGGGQLGLMIGEAAQAVGYARVTVLDPTPHCPASTVAEQLVGDMKDPAAIRQLADQTDILTFETELVNTHVLRDLRAEGKKICPVPETLAIIQDKYAQKEFLRAHAIPVVPFMPVTSREDIQRAANIWGYPLVLKARRDAYDGRGNAQITQARDIDLAIAKLAGRELYVEQGLRLDKELAVMVARNERGDIATYPVVQTIHERDICHSVLAPAPIDQALMTEAQAIARHTVGYLEGAGTFGIELFLDTTGRLWINEIAPRPHNSGHYTIEACQTSQFTQHLRAITNLSLQSTEMLYPAAAMINILGTRNGPADPQGIVQCGSEHVFVHIYGKHETMFDRKMGHITVVGDDLPTVYQQAREVRTKISM